MRKVGLTLVELAATIALLAVLVVAVLVPALLRAGEMSRRNTCQNNLKQLGVAFKVYAAEHKGDWPSVQYEKVVDPALASAYLPGHPTGLSKEQTFAATAPLMRSMYPEYLSDPSILICPSDPEDTVDTLRDASTGKFAVIDYAAVGKVSQTDASYTYFGYLLDKLGDTPREVVSETDKTYGGANVQVLLTLSAIASGVGASDESANHGLIVGGREDIAFDGAAHSGSSFGALCSTLAMSGVHSKEYGVNIFPLMPRLREGIDRILVTDMVNSASSPKLRALIVVLFDRLTTAKTAGERGPLSPHKPEGCNVLYMDGHVEFVKYGTAPVSRSVGMALGMVDF